jgi:hypothetical protein
VSATDAQVSDGSEDSALGDASASCTNCVIIANVSISPVSLALDINNVYWTNAAGADGGIGGSIESVTRSSVLGSGSPLVSSVAGPRIIALADGWLVWSASGSASGSGSGVGTVGQVNTGGGIPSTPGTGLMSPWGVAVDAKNVYWVSSGGTGAGIFVQSAPVGTAAGTLVATTLAIYDTPGGLAVNGTDLFFAATSTVTGGGAIFQVPITGGTPQTVWTTISGQPQDVALDSNNVYWVDQSAGVLYSTPLATSLSGATPKVLSTAFTTPVHLAVDSTDVYVADNTKESIFEVPIAGGAATALASGLEGQLAVAVDTSTLVYFSTNSAIISVPKL